MEIILLLVVVFVLFGGGFVVLVFGGLFKVERDQKKAEANASQILDETFNGSTVVTFTPHMRTLKAETVLVGAIERGYKLTHQAGDQYSPMVFEKVVSG